MAKVKGKEWYKIVAPKAFESKILGETLAADPDLLVGRIVRVSLPNLTGDVSKYYITLFFKVNKVDADRAVTDFFGHACTRDFLARIVQLRTHRIDTNDIIKLKDRTMRIKTIAICNRHVRASVASTIRKKITELVKEQMEKMTTEEFYDAFIKNEIQNTVRTEINKVYPIRTFEIMKSEML